MRVFFTNQNRCWFAEGPAREIQQTNSTQRWIDKQIGRLINRYVDTVDRWRKRERMKMTMTQKTATMIGQWQNRTLLCDDDAVNDEDNDNDVEDDDKHVE